jgi:ATP-dependent Clp protease ATP-binding subunit ClpX
MFFRKRRCSFCGRSEAEVDKLVSGPRVYICDRCAYETIRIMEAVPPAPPQAEARQSA